MGPVRFQNAKYPWAFLLSGTRMNVDPRQLPSVSDHCSFIETGQLTQRSPGPKSRSFRAYSGKALGQPVLASTGLPAATSWADAGTLPIGSAPKLKMVAMQATNAMLTLHGRLLAPGRRQGR